MVSRSVNLGTLAGGFPGRAEIASNDRRVQRFFEPLPLEYTALARVIVQLTAQYYYRAEQQLMAFQPVFSSVLK